MSGRRFLLFVGIYSMKPSGIRCYTKKSFSNLLNVIYFLFFFYAVSVSTQVAVNNSSFDWFILFSLNCSYASYSA
jgi:hypothetical protein